MSRKVTDSERAANIKELNERLSKSEPLKNPKYLSISPAFGGAGLSERREPVTGGRVVVWGLVFGILVTLAVNMW